jgi:hypothetical protein
MEKTKEVKKKMEVEQLAIPKKRASEEYEAYKKELQYSKTQFNKDMLSLYAHMKHGGKVIDLWEGMKLAGLNKDGDPKLAICRADSPRVQFYRKFRQAWINNNYVDAESDGGIFKSMHRQTNGHHTYFEDDVKIPKGFFPVWSKDAQTNKFIHRDVETITPIIPAKILNPLRSHKIENYHILWEVDEWKPIPPRDPILLKRITPNMFLVLATWDLTELERAVIRGRL